MEYKQKIIEILNKSNDDVKSIRDEFDLVTYILHLVTCQHDYRCIGVQEKSSSKSTTSSIESNDIKLPNGWNTSNDSYCLFYQSNKDPSITFIIKSLRMGTTLIVNAMLEVEKSRIYTLDIDTTQLIVHNDFKLLADYKDAFKNLDQLLSLYQMSILNSIIPKRISSLQESESSVVEKDKQTFKYEDMNKPDPLMVGGLKGGSGRGGQGGGRGGLRDDEDDYDYDYSQGQFRSGQSDLNPEGLPNIPNIMGGNQQQRGGHPSFGGGSSNVGRDHPGFGRVHFPYGNDEYYNTGLPGSEFIPRGAVPPGARFDPFGPVTGPPNRNPGRGGGGGSGKGRYGDEMPPPGFNNDFYS